MAEVASPGEREAHAELVRMCVLDLEYWDAEGSARIAAKHGVPNDLLMLSAVLLLRYGQQCRQGDGAKAMAFYQEAWAVFEALSAAPVGYGPCKGLDLLASLLAALAERGNDHAALWLEQLIAPLSPAEAGSLNEFVGGVRSMAAALDD